MVGWATKSRFGPLYAINRIELVWGLLALSGFLYFSPGLGQVATRIALNRLPRRDERCLGRSRRSARLHAFECPLRTAHAMRASLLAARDRHWASSTPRASLNREVPDLLLRRGFEISSKRNFGLTKETSEHNIAQSVPIR